MSSRHSRPPARFCASLHPEIFYALQVLCDARSDTHTGWRGQALDRFPREGWPVELPSALWTAVPDVLDIGPTPDFDAVISALERIEDRLFQVRLLTGLLHYENAAVALLDETRPFQQVLATLPRAKREWLARVGLYPMEPEVEVVLDRLLRAPRALREDIVATLRAFWDATFAETWEELLPAIQASVEEKRDLFERCSFKEFLRHTLLPIELVDKRNALRALRGGYELSLSKIKECVFMPSAFNDSRFWTTYSDGELESPWFPYCEPGLGPAVDLAATARTGPVPDVALIFRALGDATRFAMASLIGRCPRSAAELASLLSVSKPTISHHLHILRSAGVVHETDHKDSVLISLNRGVLQRLSDLALDRLLESRAPVAITRSRRAS